MHTVMLLAMLTAAPSASNSSARLSTGADRAGLEAAIDALRYQQIAVSRYERHTGLLIAGGITIGAAVIMPVGVLFVAAVISCFALIAGPRIAGIVFLDTLSVLTLVPPLVWVGLGILLVAGVAMVIASLIMDAPLRANAKLLRSQVRDLRRQLRELPPTAPPSAVEVPLTTLFRF